MLSKTSGAKTVKSFSEPRPWVTSQFQHSLGLCCPSVAKTLFSWNVQALKLSGSNHLRFITLGFFTSLLNAHPYKDVTTCEITLIFQHQTQLIPWKKDWHKYTKNAFYNSSCIKSRMANVLHRLQTTINSCICMCKYIPKFICWTSKLFKNALEISTLIFLWQISLLGVGNRFLESSWPKSLS